jgi:hypothetical protein
MVAMFNNEVFDFTREKNQYPAWMMTQSGSRNLERQAICHAGHSFIMKNLLIAIGAATLLCGCLTSEQPFYEQADILNDDRLIGTYGDPPYHWDIRKADEGKNYDVTVVGVGGDTNIICSMKFTGVLFHFGTNMFLDMLPVIEACDHDPNPHSAPNPGLIEMLQAVTIQPLHMVIEVRPGTNEIQFACLDKSGLRAALKKAPEFFQGGETPGIAGPRMIPDTKRQREFLIKFGSNTNIFTFQTMKKRSSGH